jgi:hypothetical protein
MEKLAAKINLIVVALLVLSAAAIFFISVVRGDLIIGIIGGALTWIGIQILKITINESA